jgi:sulfur-oxidizing protein SoxY
MPRRDPLTTRHITQATRRDVSVSGASAVFLAALLGRASPARAQEKGNGYEEALKKIFGNSPTTDAKINIELPEIAENGNTVPYTLIVDAPMTEADYVKIIYLISTGNPQAGVANFMLSPLSGKAVVSGRMRLGRTQDVLAVAALSDGRFLMTKRTVKVTIGGCGG